MIDKSTAMPLSEVEQTKHRLDRIVEYLAEIVHCGDTIAVSKARLDLYKSWVAEAKDLLTEQNEQVENRNLWLEAALCTAREVRMARLVEAGLQRTGKPAFLVAVEELVEIKRDLLQECEKTSAIARASKRWHEAAQDDVPGLLERMRQAPRFNDFEAALAAWALTEMNDE